MIAVFRMRVIGRRGTEILLKRTLTAKYCNPKHLDRQVRESTVYPD